MRVGMRNRCLPGSGAAVALVAGLLLAGCSGDPRETILPKVLTEKVPQAEAVGSESCSDCHDETGFYKKGYHASSFFRSASSGGCESCHGKGSVHSIRHTSYTRGQRCLHQVQRFA